MCLNLDGSSLFAELKQDLDEKVRTKRYVTTANGKAITSIEIAEQTGKKHSQVIRDIRVMIERLEREKETFGKPKEDKDERGYTTCYYLDGLLTETLLMGYKSAPERFKEIERRYRIEEQASTVEQIETAAKAMVEKQHLQEQKELERIEAGKEMEWAIECNKYETASDRLTDTLVWKMNHELRELIRRKAFSLALCEYGKLLMMSEVLPITSREQYNYEKIVHEKMEVMKSEMGWRVMLDGERDLIIGKDFKGFCSSVKKKLNAWAEMRIKERMSNAK